MLQRLKRKIKSGLRYEKGNSLVELALILPVLINIMAIAIEGGYSIYQQVALEQMTDAVVQSIEPSTTQSEIKSYISRNYSGYNLSDLELYPLITIKKMEYDEHIYRKDVDSHWKVPMYYQKTLTKLKVNYEMTFLTPWGKIMFGTPGNTRELHATSVAVRIVDNDAN